VLERGPHRHEREHVRSERAADSADVRLVAADRRLDSARDLRAEPVRRGRDPASDRLPDGQQVRLQRELGRVAAGPRAQSVGLVHDQERPGLARECPEGGVEARLRVDDPDVRQHRLGQDARDVSVPQLALEALDVVPLDHPRRGVERDGRAEVPCRRRR
jgi:hypothetical protein